MQRALLIISFLFLFIGNLFCQTLKNVPHNQCYSEHIKWKTKEKFFKDTIIQFRDYIKYQNDKRIICNNQIQNKIIEKIIWECSYIETFLQYQKRLNKFSFIYYRTNSNAQFIVSFYLCDLKSKEAVEMERFKIEKNKIIGINTLPCCQDIFVPIDEYDHPKELIRL